MDVTFSLTATDLRHFNWYCCLHRPIVVFTSFTATLGAFVLVAWAFNFLYRSQPPVAEWWWIPLAIAVIALNIWRTRFGVSDAVKSTPGLLGGVWIRITPTGIEQRATLTDEMVMWVRIQKVVAAPHAVYIFTEPLRAYCVPRRAFATPAEASAFVALARSYWQAARERIEIAPGAPAPRKHDRVA